MAHQDPNQDPRDRNLEEPGDTNAHDIVGRTGEQMPRQSHDGIDDDEREGGTGVNDDHDNRRTGRISDW